MAADPTPDKDIPQVLGEISQGPSAFEQFLDRNQKNLIILSIAIALGVAGFIIYQGVAVSKERSAGASLCKADDLASLQNVIKEFGGTAAAGTAAIALADRQWTDGQQGTAIETLRNFIDANPKHPAAPAAKASLAAKFKDQGKANEATALYLELSDEPKAVYLAPYAFIALGDLAKAGGDLDKAESYYQKSKTALLNNAFISVSDDRLATLKTIVPTEIEPPSPEDLAVPPLLRRPAEDTAAVPPPTPAPQPDTTPDADVPELDITNPGAGAPAGLPFGGFGTPGDASGEDPAEPPATEP